MNEGMPAGSEFSVSPSRDAVAFNTLYEFNGQPGVGNNPIGLTRLPAMDAANVLVGATFSTPTSSVSTPAIAPDGTGKQSTIYTFGSEPDVNDAFMPPIVGTAALKGAIYGCAEYGGASPGGGGNGGIYQITSNGSGGYAESVIHAFHSGPGPDAISRFGCSIIQATADGKLFGATGGNSTTLEQATLFSLAPPAVPGGKWTERVLAYLPTSVGQTPQYPMAKVGNTIYASLATGSAYGAGAIIAVTP